MMTLKAMNDRWPASPTVLCSRVSPSPSRPFALADERSDVLTTRVEAPCCEAPGEASPMFSRNRVDVSGRPFDALGPSDEEKAHMP